MCSGCLHQIQTVEQANHFLRKSYLREFNRKFTVPASDAGTAFVPTQRQDLDRVFAIQNERVVNRDNTVSWANRILQIDKTSWRASLAYSSCSGTGVQDLSGLKRSILLNSSRVVGPKSFS